MKPCRSRRPERLAPLVLAFVCLTAAAQAPLVPARPGRCESVVVVRCDPATNTAGSPLKERAQQLEERRRLPLDSLELERIVIEADPIRPSIEGTLSRSLAERPAYGTHTFTTGEGSQCTCMNKCPPFPFPCCDCSAHMSLYNRMPGASPVR